MDRVLGNPWLLGAGMLICGLCLGALLVFLMRLCGYRPETAEERLNRRARDDNVNVEDESLELSWQQRAKKL